MGKQLGDSMNAFTARWNEMMKDVPKKDWYSPENMAKYTKMYRERRDSPEYKRLSAEADRLQKDLLRFVDVADSKRNDPAVPHGYVWLFRRK